MGSCQASSVIEMSQEEAKIQSNKKILSSSVRNDIQSIISEQQKEFPDMEEWEGERYKGIGIKKMKGYKCNLQIDKLNEKRDEFWNKRNAHGNPHYKTWRVINQACVYDEYRANMLLEEYNLTTFDGCINHIVDKKGNHYIVPNYCINDPYFEKDFIIKEDVKKKEFKLNFYEVANNTNTVLEVNNLLSGEELKKLFCDKNNICFSDFNIRMFFAGSEITNNHFLYQYNIKNDYKLLVMRVPKQKNEEKEKKEVVHKKEKKEEMESEDDEEIINNNVGVEKAED